MYITCTQVTEIAFKGQGTVNNVRDRLTMTVPFCLKAVHFSFYLFKLPVSLHVAITLIVASIASTPRDSIKL